MSSFKLIDRRFFLLAGLSACGFQPVLKNGDLSQFRGKVKLPSANNQVTFWLRRELEKQFGQAVEPIYALDFQYSSTTSKLAEVTGNIIARSRLTAKGRFIAKDLRTNTVILDEPFVRIASYSGNSDRYASDRAKLTSEEQLIVSLAQEFATRFRNAALRA